MKQEITAAETQEARTPEWRRVTAAFTLGSVVILGGILIAAVVSMVMMAILFGLNS